MLTEIRHFFDINNELVFFVYGLTFFVLGLAVALQSRHRSRLTLGRSLGWLAMFGVTHGLYEWSQLFIPLQSNYMSHAGIALLQLFAVLLLGVSFGALLQFGASLLRDRAPWLPAAGGWLTVAWLVGGLLYGLLRTPGIGLWELMTTVGARYMLGIPGALLTAAGLRYQAVQQIRPLGLERIYTMLRTAGVAFAAYAVLGGVIGPYAPIFPANVVNQSLLVQWIGVPIPVFRSAAGLVILVAVIRALEVFELETDQRIEAMELAQTLAAERERIGRDLHDGALQLVYTAGLIVESARRKAPPNSVQAQKLNRAVVALDEAIAGLRAYMTGLRETTAEGTLEDGLRRLATGHVLAALVDLRLELAAAPSPAVPPTQQAHVLAIAGEALANVARHAQASQVRLATAYTDDQVQLTIEDDGVGFKPAADQDGFGLRNMRDRARLLGGQLQIDGVAGGGTSVTLTFPLEGI